MYSEDREFVERILAGEPAAFESLVRKYNRMGGAIAYAIVRDIHLAEDIVQDAFLKAYRSLGSLRDADKFKGWFAGLVRTTSLDALRRRRAHAKVQEPETVPVKWSASQVSSVEDEQIREELRAKVRQAVGELPEQDRMVIVLKHMEGLAYKEIADLMETSVSAVESRLFRARQALKTKLEEGSS